MMRANRPNNYLLGPDRVPYPVEDLNEFSRGMMEQRGLAIAPKAANNPADQWRVARTEIGDVTISTVFLGIDHQFGDGPPILFETMRFPDNDCERCFTWAEAEAMHARWVEEARKAEGAKP